MATAYVLIGAPAAGKSFYANILALKNAATIVSGDDLKQELYGSWQVHGNHDEIWGAVDEAVADAAGDPIVLDGCYYRQDQRAEALTLLRSYGYDRVEALVFNPSLATCLARNFQRARSVPDYALSMIYNELQGSLEGLELEGFDAVSYMPTGSENRTRGG